MAKDGGMGNIVLLGGLAVGGYFLYQYLSTPATAATPAAPAPSGAGTSMTQTSSGPVTTPAASSSAPPVQSLDSVYTKLKTLAAADANFTGTGDALSSSPDHWNYYVNQLLPGAAVNLDTLFGGPNRFSPITAAVFWAAAGPVLGKQFGLSGLGLFAGLGAYLHEHGQFPYGWA